MKIFGIGVLAILGCLGAPNLAHAYCVQPLNSRGFERQVNDYIEHLICLHNEQVDTLNRHADLINDLGAELDGLRAGTLRETDSAPLSIMREVVVKYSAMEAENEQLRQRIAELEIRLARIEELTK